MGSAASAVSTAVNDVGSILGGAGGSAGSAVSSLVSRDPLASLGDGLGNIGSSLDPSNIIKGLIPEVPIADQSKLIQAIANLQGQSDYFGREGNSLISGAAKTLTGAGNNSLNLMQGAAQGTAPSAAQAQLMAGKDAAIQSQQAMANSGNMSQMLGGQKAAMDNAANIAQGAANQAAQLRANEMATARQAYGNQALGQANAFGNMGMSELNLSAQQQAQAAQAAQQQAQLQQGALGQTSEFRARAIGGIMNSAGGMGAAALTPTAAPAVASDKNLKKHIKDGSKDVQSFLDSLSAKTFEYKDPDGVAGKTPGKHMGIIAQDIEKSPVGDSMIIESPEGRHIDMPSAMGMLMSAAANMNDRINEIELLFKSKGKK